MRRDTHKAAGFTLVELLAVTGIIALLIGILLPALNAAKERANRLKCTTNLHQLGVALRLYAQDNKGRLPRLYTVVGPSTHWFGCPTARDPFVAGVALQNDVTAALFLLARQKYVTLGLFICPSTDHKPDDLDGSLVTERSNFNNFSFDSRVGSTLSYSYANPYPGNERTGIHDAEYQPPPKVPAGFALAADRNDPLDRFRRLDGKGARSDLQAMNSRNHGGAGQNVLYNDGHVVWCETPFCGYNADNIFTRSGDTEGKFPKPAHKYDTVLCPMYPVRSIGD